MLTWIERASRVFILRSGRCVRSETSRLASPPSRAKPSRASGSSPCRSAIPRTTSTYRRFSPRSDGQRAKISMPPPPTIPYSSARSGASGVTPCRWLPVPIPRPLSGQASPATRFLPSTCSRSRKTPMASRPACSSNARCSRSPSGSGFAKRRASRALTARAPCPCRQPPITPSARPACSRSTASPTNYCAPTRTLIAMAHSRCVRLVFSPNWKAVGGAPLGPLIEAWAGWLGEPALGDDWLRMAGLIVGIGSNPADVVRATASPYTGWAGFNYDFFLPRPKAKEVLLLLAANGIRAVTLAGTSPDMLDLFEEVDREISLNGRRWVLGHISVLTPRDIERIARMGIVLTTHTNSNIYKQGHLWQQRLPKERRREITPMRDLLDAGVTVAL